MHRVLDAVAGELDLGQPQLLALVEVEGAGQRHGQQGRGAGPPGAEGQVGRHAVPLALEGERRVRPPVARHRPGDVVVGQDPRRRRTDSVVDLEGPGDRPTQCRRVPRRGHEVEVERRVQDAGAQVSREPLRVRQPQLADQDAVRPVRLGDPAPAPVDVLEVVAVEVRVPAGCRVGLHLGQRGVLGDQGGGVDPDAGHAPVEPEPQDLLVLPRDVGMAPVEVGLAGGEQVQVPLLPGAVRTRPRATRPVRRTPTPSRWARGRRQGRDRRGTRTARAPAIPARRPARRGTTRAGPRRGWGRRR